MLSKAIEEIIEKILKRVIDNYLLPKLKEANQDTPEYYTTKDLRDKFGLSTQSQYYYRKKNIITYTQIGKRITYPRKAVHDFIDNHTNKSQSKNDK